MSESQFRQLQDLKISTSMESFSQAIATCSKDTINDMLRVLVLANDNEELFKLLLGSLINKILSFSSENTNELAKHCQMIFSAIKHLQNPVQIYFVLLENLSQKKDEVLRLKILENLCIHQFYVSNIINLLYKENTDATVLEILHFKSDMIDEFIRESLKLDDPAVSKNLGIILPQLDSKFFVNYRSFLFLFDKESHYARNCLLDIFQSLILSFKLSGNIESISELTELVSDRLCDVNLYVRSRALSVISDLFKKECILKDQRNRLIKGSMSRIMDKTVIVRKKSINLLSQILLNHPFKNKSSLERTTKEVNNDKTTANTDQEVPNIYNKMDEDFNEFVDLMESCIALISSLLDCDIKTDLVEISTFIKISYLFKLKGSKNAIQKMLGLVFTKDNQVIIDVFKEILTHRGEILYEFINDRAFEEILFNLEIDETPLIKNILNNVKLSESIYVVKQCKKHISENVGITLLKHVTDVLFRSKDEDDLQINLKSYDNILCILMGMKHRIEYNHEIFDLISKNVIKMVFYHKTVVKYTIELIYCISNNPEKTVGKFLKNLCLSKSTLKIVDACGCVAINQFALLERLEKSMKNKTTLAMSSLSNSSSVRKSYEDIKSINDLRIKRKSLEESRKLSLSRLSVDKLDGKANNRLSLRLEELENSLQDKSDEEIADFFFYLKEREVLYSQTSMLCQILPLLFKSLTSKNLDVQIVAYSSLFKCMMISSEFFFEHKQQLIAAFSHESSKIRNVAIVAMHDLLIFYNTSLDSTILFEMLNDTEISKNALLVIYSLLQKSIIRIRNNSVSLMSLLFNKDLGTIVKTLITNFSVNNNLITVIFYETYMSSLSIEHVSYLSAYIPVNLQESMFIKCLKTNTSVDRLKVIFEKFELNEKFIKENMFRDQMKLLVPQIDE